MDHDRRPLDGHIQPVARPSILLRRTPCMVCMIAEVV